MRTTRAIDTLVRSVRTRASAMTRAQWVEAGVVAGIALMTALLYLWGLSRNGMGNSYYAAAVKSATLS